MRTYIVPAFVYASSRKDAEAILRQKTASAPWSSSRRGKVNLLTPAPSDAEQITYALQAIDELATRSLMAEEDAARLKEELLGFVG